MATVNINTSLNPAYPAYVVRICPATEATTIEISVYADASMCVPADLSSVAVVCKLFDFFGNAVTIPAPTVAAGVISLTLAANTVSYYDAEYTFTCTADGKVISKLKLYFDGNL